MFGFKEMKKMYESMYSSTDKQNEFKIDGKKDIMEESEENRICTMDPYIRNCPFIAADKEHCTALHSSCHFLKTKKQKNGMIERYYEKFKGTEE